MSEPSKEDRRTLEAHARELALSGDPSRLERIAQLVGLAQDQVQHALSAGTEGRGTLDARVVVLSLPRDTVAGLLPAGLQLAPQPLTTPDRHPVLVLFSHEHFDAWFGEMDYRELLLGVPWVELSDVRALGRGPFLYMPRLYLDQPLPRVLGNRLYGFEKLQAAISDEPETYTVRTEPGGALLMEGRFEVAGEPVAPGDLPNLDRVLDLLEQPTISQALRIVDDDAFTRPGVGPFLGTNNRYRFDDEAVRVTPLRATVRVGEDFTPAGLPAGPLEVPSIATTALGAFHVRVPQEIALPGSIHDLRYPPARPAGRRRRRVAVLGGGAASCAAAFHLAASDELEVTLYAPGFRLGEPTPPGVGEPPAIPGFYDNALRMVREVYERAGLPLPRGEAPWSVGELSRGEGPLAEALAGTLTLGPEGGPPVSSASAPNEARPGEVPRDDRGGPPGFARALKLVFTQAIEYARALHSADAKPTDDSRRIEDESSPDVLDRLLDRVEEGFERVVRVEEWALYQALDRALDTVEKAAAAEVTEAVASNTAVIRGLTRVLRRLRTMARRRFADARDDDPQRWAAWSGLDVMLTIAIGVFTERVVHFDVLDEVDLRQWLVAQGLAPGNEHGPLVQALVRALGGSEAPGAGPMIAAGVGLRWLVLSMDYRGFPGYVPREGAGPDLFAPYVRALRAQGVELRFFHRVEGLEIDREGETRRLRSVRLRRQATVAKGPGAYDPLWMSPGDDGPRWPDRPDYAQLEGGEALREHDPEAEAWPGEQAVELRAGEDFELCVCGVPRTAVPALVGDLTERDSAAYSEPWAQMIATLAIEPPPPGSLALRLGPSESWVQDLWLCGDWTRTDLGLESIEAATQSGMLCARAITQHPRYVWRLDY